MPLETDGQGPGLELQAGLSLAIGNVEKMMDAQEAYRRKCALAIQQVPIVCPPIITANGVADYPDTMKAKTGYYWSVRRLTLTGWSAGACTVYKNFNGGEPLAPFPVPAVYTFGRGEMLLNPDDRLVVVAAGITGQVNIWAVADCFEAWYLTEYIG